MMPTTEETQLRLAGIPNLTVSRHTPLSRYTRFGIGGPADLFAETAFPAAFARAVAARDAAGLRVCFFVGRCERAFDTAQCEFHYRESIFKRHKDWVIFAVDLGLTPDDATALTKVSADILKIRNEKFPPTMKCAGSIFKNFLL